LDFATNPRYHFERIPDALGIGDSFYPQLAVAGLPVDREILPEGAYDALAFLHGAVGEKLASVGEAGQGGVYQGLGVGRPGRGLLERAEAARSITESILVVRFAASTNNHHLIRGA
jgi:hypothetical protein